MAESLVDPGARPRAATVNVLFLNTPVQPPLGADTWVHAQIIRALDRRDHRVHAACAVGPPGSPTPAFEALRDIDGLAIEPVDLGTKISRDSVGATVRGVLSTVSAASLSLIRLVRYVRRHGIDVVHTSDRPRDAVTAVLLAALTGTKSIIHVHVAWGTWMSPALRWALRRADGLVAVSEFVATSLAESGHDPTRIHVVLNAIDVTQWTPRTGRDDVRREFGIVDDGALVLSVCRLFPEKGAEALIRACALARNDVSGLRVVIAGEDVTPDGHFSIHLAAVVNELAMSDVVEFVGVRDDVPRLMAGADVFAMPSYGEPFGLVFAEAMAMEVPVVGLDHGGTVEVVDNGRTGLLAEPGDVDALATMIVKLLQDPQLRDQLGRAGRARVLDRFTVDRMADDVARVYRRVLGRATGGG
jgi:glycosyltransferase involved in cell wall biosynthesis